MTRHDAVVIGAGLGGLTAAAVLARAGRRVLVLERSSSVGGAASSYKVGDLFVEGSLHETSNPQSGSDPKHDILVRAGVRDAVDWIPSGQFYQVRGGPLHRAFNLPDNFTAARDALMTDFPQHRIAITQLLDELRFAASALTHGHASVIQTDVRNDQLSLAQKLDDAFGNDEAVKCVFAANLAYYHDDPATLPWRVFAEAQGRYLLNGACFIHGGSQRLSSALARAIRAAGGQVLLRRTASNIAFDVDGHPIAVSHTRRDGSDRQIAHGARLIVNAAPGAIMALLPKANSAAWSEAYASRQPSISLFTLTLGLSAAPSHFGISSYSTQLLPDWMSHFNQYAGATRLMRREPDGRLPPLSIVDYAAIDAGIPAPPYVLSIMGPDHIDNWQGLSVDQYRVKRDVWQRALIACLNVEFPGLADAVVATSFNTAHSVQTYLGVPHGAVYGFAPAAGPGSPRTPLPHVYLASAYAGVGGYTGVIEAANACADMILGES